MPPSSALNSIQARSAVARIPARDHIRGMPLPTFYCRANLSEANNVVP